MKTIAIVVWVRLQNIPLHLWTLKFLATISNLLGRFITIDIGRISKGLITFARIYVEMDLSAGLPDILFIDWTDDEPYTQLIDYENTAFRCKSCQ